MHDVAAAARVVHKGHAHGLRTLHRFGARELDVGLELGGNGFHPAPRGLVDHAWRGHAKQ